MRVLSCDPGLEGAFAVYGDGQLLQVVSMPTFVAKVSGKDRRQIDPAGIMAIVELQHMLGAQVFAIEEVQGIAGQSASAAFNFGRGATWPEAFAMQHRMRIERVRPQEWKSRMRCPADKRAARQRASQVFPEHAHLWPLQKDDGKAEAALIAKYVGEHRL